MHSWIFRNRERLRVLFGLELPDLSAPILTGLGEDYAEDPIEVCEGSTLPDPVPAAEATPGRKIPGTVRRTSRYVVLEPMPPLKNAG